MNISIHNYETYLIDYFDGKLNANEVAEVLLFLERHPEIKQEFEGITKLEPETTHFNASALYKPELKELLPEYEPLLVAQLEGDITAEESALLQKGFVLYPELHQQQKLFAQTKLIPESQLVFENKNLLKKGNVLVLYTKQLTRIAAVFVLLGMAGITYKILNSNHTPTPVAQQTLSAIQPEIVQSQPEAKQMTQALQPQHSNPVRQKLPGRLIVSKTMQVTLIQSATAEILNSTPSLSIEPLKPLNQQLAYQQPATQPTDDRFLSIQDLLRKTFVSESKNIEQKTLTAIHEMNQTAGVVIKKDSTGKINHLEIGALGFAWSK